VLRYGSSFLQLHVCQFQLSAADRLGGYCTAVWTVNLEIFQSKYSATSYAAGLPRPELDIDGGRVFRTQHKCLKTKAKGVRVHARPPAYSQAHLQQFGAGMT